MRLTVQVGLLLALAIWHSEATSLDSLIFKRQASETEQEATSSTTAKPATDNNNNNQPQQPPARLYPDIAHQPHFLPPFNGNANANGHQHHYPAHHGPTPLVPFGMQIPPNRLNVDQQPAPFGRVFTTPRPTTAAERLQSQSFADGLGRRLLSMIGIDTSASNQTQAQPAAAMSQEQQQQQQAGAMMDDTMRALQNSSVLQQLNRGVNSIYGSLSKMYNSTVQEQLNLLQERFKAETANSTNPWHQRMAQQVPQFFKQMTSKVVEAQEQLNRVWRDVSNGSMVASGGGARNGGQPSFFNSPFMDQISNDVNGMFQPGGFFNNMGRSLGFNGNNNNNNNNGQPGSPMTNMMNNGQQQQPAQRDLMGQMREFWVTQVQPQLGMVRNQAARVWRDLTSSGALTSETIMRSRSGNNNNNNNLGSSANSNSELVDNILKEVDMSNSEYTLIEPKGDGADGSNAANNDPSNNNNNNKPENKEQEKQMPKLSPQMQNGLINVQRELNQVWMGLTNSLQNALNNVQRSLNPGPTFATMDPAMMASNQPPKPQTADPAQNEIDGKIKDLSKLQRDTDMVYDAVQQQQREAQQRQTFGDRFKSFFNNVDLSGMEQLPNRVGQSVSRFGTVMGDLWNQIPERWDNLMTNMRPQQQQPSQADMMAKLKATASASSTPKTTTIAE